MSNIPFPQQLAADSAAAAKAGYESRKGQRPGDHVSKGVACYRTAEGELRMAYDPYRPEYPAGATPGLGNVQQRLEHFPNDTSGYRSTVTDFYPADELLAEAGPWDNPSAVVIKSSHCGSSVFIAPSGEIARELADKRNPKLLLNDDYKNLVSDPVHPRTILAGEPGEAPTATLYTNAGYDKRIWLGTPAAVISAVCEAYKIDPPSAAEKDQARTDYAGLFMDTFANVEVMLVGEALAKRFPHFDFIVPSLGNFTVMEEALSIGEEIDLDNAEIGPEL